MNAVSVVDQITNTREGIRDRLVLQCKDIIARRTEFKHMHSTCTQFDQVDIHGFMNDNGVLVTSQRLETFDLTYEDFLRDYKPFSKYIKTMNASDGRC